MTRLRSGLVVLALALVAAACTSDGDGPRPTPTGPQDQTIAAQLATSDHFVGDPQRVGVGVIRSDQKSLSFGSVDMTFSYVGTADAPQEPELGPTVTAVYLPTPGSPDDGGGPRYTLPSEGRGIYLAEDVTFDRAGFWQIDVTTEVDGVAQRASTTMGVLEDPAYPAPGERALETENLTVADAERGDAPVGAVDSRAVAAGDVPDPELHDTTIADAVAAGHPALVVFSTPTFCLSRFCGPVTEVVEDLAGRYSDRAEFIHVEIWRDNVEQVVNQAAADWLLRDGELTEPWLYLIGADGRIVDRWATLWRAEEIEAALEALPPMEA